MSEQTTKRVRLGEMIAPAPVVKCGTRNLPVLSMTMHDGLMLQSDRFKKKIASTDLSGYKVVAHNQLVVSFPIDEGVLSVQDIVDEGIVSPAYAVWNVNENIVLPKFLETFLRCPISIDFYKSKLRGSTARRRTIPKEAFLSMLMPAYSLAEQKRIAEVLDKISAMKRNAEARVQKLDLLVRARFNEMFGDLTLNSKLWPVFPLGEMCDIVRGGSPRPIDKFLGGTIPWIKIGDATIGDNIFLHRTKEHIIDAGLSKTRIVKPGSLIFANCGVSLGFARIVTFEGCIHDGWLALSNISESLDKIFLLYSLNRMTEHFRAIAPAGTQPNLNTDIMKRHRQVVPPINVQRAFVAYAEQVEKLKARVQREIEQVDLLYRAKLQEYFG